MYTFEQGYGETKTAQRNTCKTSWPVRRSTVQTPQQRCELCQETSLSGPTTSPSMSHPAKGESTKQTYMSDKKNKIKYAIKRNISWIKAHTDRIDPHAHLIWSLLKSVVNTVRLSCYCHDMQNNNMIMKLVLLRLNTTFNTPVFCCKHTEHRVRHCLSNPDR